MATPLHVQVVNKPSTVAMHPCGAYRYNSLFHILDAERKATKAAAVAHGKDEAEAEVNEEALHIVHRLDRLTSGLTLFAKSPEVSTIVLRRKLLLFLSICFFNDMLLALPSSSALFFSCSTLRGALYLLSSLARATTRRAYMCLLF